MPDSVKYPYSNTYGQGNGPTVKRFKTLKAEKADIAGHLPAFPSFSQYGGYQARDKKPPILVEIDTYYDGAPLGVIFGAVWITSVAQCTDFVSEDQCDSDYDPYGDT